jgi:serine/threonine-protein kinase
LQVVHETSRFPRPFGKYVLLRQLAVGGMAEVYLARQSGPAGFEKECVIKRILPSLAADQQFVRMFLDEARIAARLSHPHIVQIYDLGKLTEQDYYLAMEHVPGVDLQQIAEAEQRRGGHVPLQIALRLISNIAEGLDHAHRATDARGAPLGVVHRDVTPSNVIVSVDGVAKILDFGIAKAVAKEGHTEVGVIKGKIPYMSPEQVQGEAIDARSDIFSLGTVLYELTVGQRPFAGQNAAELSIQILHDEPTAPEVVIESYPERLGAIIRRAMAKRRADRYPNAREMQEAIEEFLVSRSIRCTAHDVAGYLEGLFPALREQTQADSVAAQGLPIEVTAPTVPNIDRAITGGGINGRQRPAGPVVAGDLSSTQLGSFEDVRRNFGGGGGGAMGLVALALVLAVAAAFWYLTSRAGGPQSASLPSAPAPASPAAPKPAPPVVSPEPVEAAEPQAQEPAQAVSPPAAPRAEEQELPARPTTPHGKPAASAKPHHAPPPVHHIPQDDRPLPRLPSPPPPDDE